MVKENKWRVLKRFIKAGGFHAIDETEYQLVKELQLGLFGK